MTNSGNRIKTWDELRGVAIVLMVFTHFFYYDASRLYSYRFSNLFDNLNGVTDFLAGTANLHASYLAPFLFLFIVGIISNIKFSKQKRPDILETVRRFIKLYFSTIVITLIFFYKDGNLLSVFTHFDRVLFNLNNILMTIAVVYLMNEFILLYGIDYYRKSIALKSCVIIAGAVGIIAFNVFSRSSYSNYHLLPTYVTVLLGFYMALLGDFFVCIYNPERLAASRNLLSFVALPLLFCFAGYIVLAPEFGAIKCMNFIYFAYCLFITYLIVCMLSVMDRIRVLEPVKELLVILGRYSLTLYIFHFFIGYTIEKLVLSPFVPQKFWHFNSVVVLIFCILMAVFFEYVNRQTSFRFIHKGSRLLKGTG